MKIKTNTESYFAIPLQKIDIPEFKIDLPEQFVYCSVYNPDNQDPDESLYFIKVYEFFSFKVEKDPDLISVDLIFGESRHYPIIPVRGRMKWQLLKTIACDRSFSDLPNLKESNLLTDRLPSERTWYLIKNGGINTEPIKSDYQAVKHLEYAIILAEVGVKYRVYIHLIKSELQKLNKTMSLAEWKRNIFILLRNEESNRRISDNDLMNGMIENYIYDFLDVWSWDPVPEIDSREIIFKK